MTLAELLRTYRIWLISALLGYSIFLILNIPASSLFHQLSTYGITASRSSGSIWHGQIHGLHVGEIDIGEVNWQLRLMPLIKGQLSADIKVNRPDGNLNAQIGINIFGLIQIKNLDATLSLNSLMNTKKTTDSWAGTLRAKFTEVDIKNNLPISAKGTLDILDLTGPAQKSINMGSYRITFPARSSNTEALIGDIKNLEGANLIVSGQFKLTRDRNYLLDTQLIAQPDAPPNIKSALQYLGAADSQGRHPLSIAGSF